jgi:hypothetical protein
MLQRFWRQMPRSRPNGKGFFRHPARRVAARGSAAVAAGWRDGSDVGTKRTKVRFALASFASFLPPWAPSPPPTRMPSSTFSTNLGLPASAVPAAWTYFDHPITASRGRARVPESCSRSVPRTFRFRAWFESARASLPRCPVARRPSSLRRTPPTRPSSFIRGGRMMWRYLGHESLPESTPSHTENQLRSRLAGMDQTVPRPPTSPSCGECAEPRRLRTPDGPCHRRPGSPSLHADDRRGGPRRVARAVRRRRRLRRRWRT